MPEANASSAKGSRGSANAAARTGRKPHAADALGVRLLAPMVVESNVFSSLPVTTTMAAGQVSASASLTGPLAATSIPGGVVLSAVGAGHNSVTYAVESSDVFPHSSSAHHAPPASTQSRQRRSAQVVEAASAERNPGSASRARTSSNVGFASRALTSSNLGFASRARTSSGTDQEGIDVLFCPSLEK